MQNALPALSSMLSDLSIDFANIVEINERSDVYSPPAPFSILNARCGQPVIDSTSLIYDSSVWTPVSPFKKGCMYFNDRPFLIQTFQRSSTEKVIVVGAHFPHGAGNGKLQIAVKAELRLHPDVLGVIFAADTNRESYTPTESIMARDVLGSVVDKIISAQKFPSCCHNDGFRHHYDRIAATFGTSVTTQMLLHPAPWWANNAHSEFHKAVVATFHM